MMRVIFMGTPDIARKSLQQLYDDGHDVVAVFTGADKPRGRGHKLSPSPVKELALTRNTPVYHPENLNTETILPLKCDVITVVAFGKILRSEILDIPPLGSVNIHGSVLPKYRGAAPIQHAILNGETETGVTSQYMAREMDAGDIIFIKKTPIHPEETSGDLFERIGDMGAKLLSETLTAIEQGSAPRIPQDHSAATFAPMLTKELSPIDWDNEAGVIHNKVRALIPWPVATMEYCGKTLKVPAVEIINEKPGMPPGSIINKPGGIFVACKNGIVNVKRVQAPGSRVMEAAEYLRGIRPV